MKSPIVRARVLITRILGLAILFLVSFTASSISRTSILGVSLELSGFLLLTLAALGRLWALSYISGNKNVELVTAGPYSVMRHPLYFFSFIGFLGIGLVSQNVLVLGIVTVFYVVYYPIAIHGEEKKLVGVFGQAYLDYRTSVPAIVPRLSLYHAPPQRTVNMANVIRRVGDATWFLWAFVLLRAIQSLQDWNVLPVLWTAP